MKCEENPCSGQQFAVSSDNSSTQADYRREQKRAKICWQSNGGSIAIDNPHVTREKPHIHCVFTISSASRQLEPHGLIRHLLGLGQTNGVVAKVIDAVPFAQERVTKNGQRADGLGEVHSHEAADARALNLQDVVVRSDSEVVAAQSECEVRQRVTGSTVNGVLASEALGSTDLLVPVCQISNE